MSDSDTAGAWSSRAHPFSDPELREYENRFAQYEYDLLDFDRDVRWPGEADHAQ